jgi:anion-transporting  ArsA/GET3 family ATPase
MTGLELFEKRVLILSGKGGVGKSVVTAALAWIAAQRGKNTLLVELDTMETLPRLFGKPPGERYHECSLAPGISCIHVDGKSSLEEYLQLVLKSRKLLQRVFRSPLYQYFVNIAPGLKELMAVGKLWDLERKTSPGTRHPLYDLILVDTPATGHTLSYLRMPLTAADTVKKGLVNREAQKVADLLQDPCKTSFLIVTTPAEMPVNEAVELHDVVVSQLRIPIGCIFVNQVYPPFFRDREREAYRTWKASIRREQEIPDPGPDSTRDRERIVLACAESWQRRREAQEIQMERLCKNIPEPQVQLPLLLPTTESSLEMIQELAAAMEKEIGSPAGEKP